MSTIHEVRGSFRPEDERESFAIRVVCRSSSAWRAERVNAMAPGGWEYIPGTLDQTRSLVERRLGEMGEWKPAIESEVPSR